MYIVLVDTEELKGNEYYFTIKDSNKHPEEIIIGYAPDKKYSPYLDSTNIERVCYYFYPEIYCKSGAYLKKFNGGMVAITDMMLEYLSKRYKTE